MGSSPWTTTQYLLLLSVAALSLYLPGLGGQALRDWDEATVASVALGIAEEGFSGWWHPTLWGAPYINKPPFLHGLIALSMRIFGTAEWAVRLPAAIISAAGVPILFLLLRDIGVRHRSALIAAGIFLTLLPVMRHGRMAMLDGVLVTFLLAFLLCLRRADRSVAMSLCAALALALMTMTKGLMGPLLGVLACVLVLWERPFLLRAPGVWMALGLGTILPTIWVAAQWIHYGEEFAGVFFWSQGVARAVEGVEGNSGPVWYYLVDLVEFSGPWVAALPLGVWLAWRERQSGWGKFVLVFLVGYVCLISLVRTKLPWYLHPAYPALALACSMAVSWLMDDLHTAPVRRSLVVVLVLIALSGCVGIWYFSPFGVDPVPVLSLGGAALAIAAALAGWMLAMGDTRCLTVLLAGIWACLLLFTLSPRWNWELREDFAVKPVAALVTTHVPPGAPVFVDHLYERPSLSFYARRRIPALFDGNAQGGPEAEVVYVLRPTTPEPVEEVVARTPDWVLTLTTRSALGDSLGQ